MKRNKVVITEEELFELIDVQLSIAKSNVLNEEARQHNQKFKEFESRFGPHFEEQMKAYDQKIFFDGMQKTIHDYCTIIKDNHVKFMKYITSDSKAKHTETIKQIIAPMKSGCSEGTIDKIWLIFEATCKEANLSIKIKQIEIQSQKDQSVKSGLVGAVIGAVIGAIVTTVTPHIISKLF